MYSLVIITSNTPPSGWYKGDEVGQPGKRTDALLALWDRIGYTNGGYVPARQCGHYLEAPVGLSIQQTRNWFERELQRACDLAEPISDGDEMEDDDDDNHTSLAAAGRQNADL